MFEPVERRHYDTQSFNRAAFARVPVDGRQASLCVDVPLGAPGNPLSDAALEEKFFSLVVRVIPREQAQELLEQLWKLDELESAGTLDRWLT